MTLLPMPLPPCYVPYPREHNPDPGVSDTFHRKVLLDAARQKLMDALTLCQNGRYMASMYLAGYVIECGYKALFCYQQGKDFERIPEGHPLRKSHSVSNILQFLKPATQNEINASPTLKDAWTNVEHYWNDKRMFDLRYNPNEAEESHAQIFLCSALALHEFLASQIEEIIRSRGNQNRVPSEYTRTARQINAQVRRNVDCTALQFPEVKYDGWK